MLMVAAFLAGLATVGVALLWPGSSGRQEGAGSSFAPPPLPTPPARGLPADVPAALPRLAIVVDDLGYEPSRDSEWLKFPEKITVAVLPFGPSSRKVAESARKRGWGVILHIPMEPESETADRTEGFRLRRGMGADEMESLLARMIEELPEARGASNHMGSAFTADGEAMTLFAAALKKRGLFLLDSVTTPRSVALEAARQAGVPAARRDILIDPSMKPEEMRRQWERAVSTAKEKGSAIVICQGRPEILKVMLDLIPGLRGEKILAATVEELLEDKGA